MGDSPAVREPDTQRAGAARTCSKCGQQNAGPLHRCTLGRTANFSAKAMARVGTRLKEYELKSVIGEGVIGVVYRAQNIVKDKPVAIKVLHEHCAGQKDLVEKFIAEAKTASRIHHPNIADVTDFGSVPDGTIFVVMEYLDGESLEDRLHRAGNLPLFEAINIVRQVVHGLGAAHEHGIVHRDLKPANIFLCRREGKRRIVRRSKETGMRFAVVPEESFDLVKLLDFGAAKLIDFAPSAQTPAGAICGTLHYLSPEQVEGRPGDQRSDIYALGAIFYEMVTGSVPFSGETVLEVLSGHLSGAVTAPSRRAPEARMDLRMDSLILKCLKKNPLLRFAGTSELCEVLDGCVTDCAFLRDAHRLPGITYSGIDLSEASPEARHDSAPVAERPAAALVERPAPAEQSTAKESVKVAAKAHVVETATKTPIPFKPAVAPVAKLAPAATIAMKPAAAARVVDKAAAPLKIKLAAIPLAKPAELPIEERPTPAPLTKQVEAVAPEAGAPIEEMPTETPTPTLAQRHTPAPLVQREAEAPVADDPAASMKTPPALVVAADFPAAVPARIAVSPASRTVEDNDFDSDAEAVIRASRGRRMMAFVGVLLIGVVAVAIWAVRGGSGPSSTKPSTATSAAPATVPALPTPPKATAPAPTLPAPAPAPAAPPIAAAPVPTPPVPTAASPLLAEPAKTTERAAGKPASTRPRPARQNSARRTAPVPPEESETAPSTTAEAAPEPEPPAPSPAAAAPQPTPPAPTPPAPTPPAPTRAPSPTAAAPTAAPAAPASVDDLVREAQQAWIRGHHAVAISRAQAALKAGPTPAQSLQSYQIIGSSSCAIGKVAEAREAITHLDETRREMLKAVCEKNGVTIE